MSPGLEKEPIYVYGSSLSGATEGESAGIAAKIYGAEPGAASGATGHAYAIPYRNSAGALLAPDVMVNYVDGLLKQAGENPQQLFHVARFACKNGAHGDGVMTKLFRRAPPNCLLPGLWSALLNADQPARLVIYDPGAHFTDAAWSDRLEKYVDLNLPLWNVPSIEFVSFGDARMVVANDKVAKALGFKHRVFGANDKAYGRDAGIIAEHKAIWYATHLLTVVDLEQTAQPQQVRVLGAATRNGLGIDQLTAD